MKKDSQFIFILIVLGISCLFSWNFFFKTYSQKDSYSIHQFPKSFDGWESKELTITDEEYAILETRNAFARRYFNNQGQEVMLYIIYSQNNRKVSHPPEVCYTGGGMSVTGRKIVDISSDASGSSKNKNSLQANQLSLEQGNSKELSYYWFKVGDSFTPSYWKQQLLIAVKSLTGKPSSSAMIRVSAIVNQGDVKKAEVEAESFIKTILPKLFEYLP